MKYLNQSLLRRRSGAVLSVFLLSACAHTEGSTTLSDGNVMRVSGYGSDVDMNWKCLKEDALVQLTSSAMPPDTPKSDCYMAVIVAAKSSSISRAVDSYLARSGELQAQATRTASLASTVATSAGPRAVVAAQAAASAEPPSSDNPAATSVANSLAATAAAAPDSSAIQAAASSVGPMLSAQNRVAVQQQLQDLSLKTPDLALSDRLRGAADQLGQSR